MSKKKNEKKECGVCGERFSKEEMIEDYYSDTGYVCADCYIGLHPEYEDLGEY